MGRTYKLGKRFHRVKYVCIVAEMLVMYAFHFIYQLCFPNFNQFALGVGFAAAAVLIAFATYHLLNWCADHLWYQITDEGLSVCRGGKVKVYPWSDFKAAGVETINILDRLPVYFLLQSGQRLHLEQYIEGLGSLTVDILERIKDHADISETLVERLKTAKAMQESGRRV